MYKKFIKYIEENNLINDSQLVLLAVSGGVDSMVMLDLFRKTNNNIGIAHCNFKLRGKESDDDKNFVEEIAKIYKIPFFSINFDTENYAKKYGISIQMAARTLRYNWFEKTRSENNYDLIAIAHNANDVIETFFVNLARGTGINGLVGISAKSGFIVRPLLNCYRIEIFEYAIENKIEFREDSSNQSIKYKRNFIRHKILPLFEELNPDFKVTVSETIQRLKQAEQIYRQQIESKRKDIIIVENDKIIFSGKQLDKLNPLKPYLFEYLNSYGFSNDSIEKIIQIRNQQSGKMFYSETHKLLIDRKNLIITPIVKLKNEVFYIEENDGILHFPIKLKLQKFTRKNSLLIIKDERIAQVDFEKLKFPLMLRKWQKGDVFYPLGLGKKKKVSDFFIDLKMNRIEKDEIWILESVNEIVWIIGKRIDNRYKITENTKVIFEISWDAISD